MVNTLSKRLTSVACAYLIVLEWFANPYTTMRFQNQILTSCLPVALSLMSRYYTQLGFHLIHQQFSKLWLEFWIPVADDDLGKLYEKWSGDVFSISFVVTYNVLCAPRQLIYDHQNSVVFNWKWQSMLNPNRKLSNTRSKLGSASFFRSYWDCLISIAYMLYMM